MVSFSILVCSYNPDQKIFSRLLNAISDFHSSSPNHEVILIDNNSEISLNSMDFVNDFIKNGHKRKLIVETEPGLTNARIAGIKAAQHDWIIFFDDDNEPFSDYLIEADKAISQFSEVGVWGPGQINVDFLEEKYPLWALDYKKYFQERKVDKIKFDNNYWWQHCYPFGTGFLLIIDVCLEYVKRVEEKQYSLTDRIEKMLSSGGDMQMVYTALKMGYFVGVIPGLKLNHLINSSKLSCRYIAKMLYGTASSNLPAYYQSFPDLYQTVTYPSIQSILKKLYFFIKVVLFSKGIKEFYFQLSRYLGELEGLIILEPKIRKPFLVCKLEKILFLK